MGWLHQGRVRLAVGWEFLKIISASPLRDTELVQLYFLDLYSYIWWASQRQQDQIIKT